MKYLCLGYLDGTRWDALSSDDRAAFWDECADYDDFLYRSGHAVGGEAIQSTRTATTVRMRHGRLTIGSGPVSQTAEQLYGVIALRARDLNQAIQLMADHPVVRIGASVELWPVEEGLTVCQLAGAA